MTVERVGTALDDFVEVKTERGRGRAALVAVSVVRETRFGRWGRASTTTLADAMVAGDGRSGEGDDGAVLAESEVVAAAGGTSGGTAAAAVAVAGAAAAAAQDDCGREVIIIPSTLARWTEAR